jgi:superfamily II DNA or RNA helicase
LPASCWGWIVTIAAGSPRWSEPVPRLVAEALVEVARPTSTASGWIRSSPPEVVGAMAAAARLPEAQSKLPGWLRDEQARCCRRAIAAIEQLGAALIAEPPGTGKTWIALAAVLARFGGRASCLVPASVATQWERTAARLGAKVRLVSHEAASRGTLPSPDGLIVIDESHRFRNPSTRRYDHVARWVLGRPALLLTATPAVNRLADIVHQLQLVLSDDVLAPWGVPSLAVLATADSLPDAICRVVLRSPGHRSLPRREEWQERPAIPRSMHALLHGIDQLALDADAPVAGLVRGVLVRAAASSPAALLAALVRYRALLESARDAGEAGRALSRSALRRWAGVDGQLVMWPLIPDEGDMVLLPLEDLSHLDRLVELAKRACEIRDPRVERLSALLRDGRRTLVFTTARATVHYVARRLGRHRVAWCTGDDAGIGSERCNRDTVLGLFRPGPLHELAPRVLVTSDVSAEGLDLHGAERVIHYDLPWTPARLEQREGRAIRHGAAHEVAEVVRFIPPAVIERRLGQLTILSRKSALPARAQLLNQELLAWPELLDELAQTADTRSLFAAAMDQGPRGILAALQLYGHDGNGARTAGSRLVWLSAGGEIREDVATLTAAIRRTRVAADITMISEGAPRRSEQAILERALARASVDSLGVTAGQNRRAARALIRRLGLLAGEAARRRDAAGFERWSRASQWLSRIRTAGTERVAATLAGAPTADLEKMASVLPPPPPLVTWELRVTHVIAFRSASDPLR